MVWADTNEVGCGMTHYKEDRWYKTLLTCNYSPQGNFINSPMYQRGEPCSACPGSCVDSLCTGPTQGSPSSVASQPPVESPPTTESSPSFWNWFSWGNRNAEINILEERLSELYNLE